MNINLDKKRSKQILQKIRSRKRHFPIHKTKRDVELSAWSNEQYIAENYEPEYRELTEQEFMDFSKNFLEEIDGEQVNPNTGVTNKMFIDKIIELEEKRLYDEECRRQPSRKLRDMLNSLEDEYKPAFNKKIFSTNN